MGTGIGEEEDGGEGRRELRRRERESELMEVQFGVEVEEWERLV